MEAEGRSAQISGWGLTGKNGRRPSSFLQSKTISLQRCPDDSATSSTKNKHILCSDDTLGGACNGDSGGPLVSVSNDGLNTPVLIGIVSFGTGLSCFTGYTAYTQISQYLLWIQSNVLLYELYDRLSSIQRRLPKPFRDSVAKISPIAALE